MEPAFGKIAVPSERHFHRQRPDRVGARIVLKPQPWDCSETLQSEELAPFLI
jgi:hypothetical protein